MEVRHIPICARERDDRYETALALWWMETIDASVRTVGEEKTMTALAPVFRQIGRQDGMRVKFQKHIYGRDAISLATYVNFLEDLMGIQGKFIETTPEKEVKENYSCPLGGGPPEACELLEQCIKGSAEEISPEFAFIQTHALTRGDNKCRWEIKRAISDSAVGVPP